VGRAADDDLRRQGAYPGCGAREPADLDVLRIDSGRRRSAEPRSDEATTFYLLDPKEHRKGGHPSALVVAEADFVNAERLRDDRDDEFLEIHMRGDIKVTVRPLAAGQTGKAAAI
jgi:hypothetical protein